MSTWTKSPSGSLRMRSHGYVAMITTGPNTFTHGGNYRHANIRPPLTSNANEHIFLNNYKTIRDLKSDCETIMLALHNAEVALR